MRKIRQNNLIKNLSQKAATGLVFGVIATGWPAGTMEPTNCGENCGFNFMPEKITIRII